MPRLVCLHRKRINISTVLAGQRLDIKEVDEGIWLASFMGGSCRTSIRARLWDSGTDGMCPSVPTIEGEKSPRIKGFEYADGTVGTSGLGQAGHCPFHHRGCLQPGPGDPMRKLTWPMFWRCNRLWAMPTAGARSVPSIWRRPAPRVRLEVRAAAKRGTVMRPNGDGPAIRKSAAGIAK